MNSLKITVLLALILPFNNFVNATDNKNQIYLSYCTNYGAGVDYSFQSCINMNNSSIAREIGGFYSSCMNYGQQVDYFFTSCVNQGFREAERQLNNSIYLSDCENYNSKTLDFFYVSCVNNNYSEIQRAIKLKK
ncbi:MAG: hypothetical protein H7281_06645 [Bacteriovorax sp.]|nr:hypothetical protein [Bacteriovorax sp.]